GLADLAGLPTTATGGQMMIGILKSNTVVDAIIDRFNLMELYEEEFRLAMRKTVVKSILEAEEDAESGIVTVAALDEDPVRAADLANAFVEELQKKLQGLSLTEAGQRRLFFEAQLKQAQQVLSDAEDAMLRYQKESGVVVLGPQMQALLDSITQLRDQIAAKKVQISSLQTYAKQDNPQLKVARSQLAAMNRELKQLEEQQKQRAGEVLSTMGEAPETSLEYGRYARELRYASATYDVMLKQFEAAKLDEAKDFSTVQIVDTATPPDYKYKPSRALICIIGTLLGFLLGCGWAFFASSIHSMKDEWKAKNSVPA
ncbi:MAG: hypothetical protein K6E38_08145, partial [Fretibacterium sp.]|nr:hypothetical protein [Fretibacterium sp.]